MSKYGHQKSYGAPKPIVIKVQKLDVAGLAAAYEWMPVAKPVAFRLVMDWYGKNVTSLLRTSPLTGDRQAAFDKGVKAQALGDHAGTPQEAIQAWSTAARLFEKAWTGQPLPTVDAALAVATPNRSVAAVQNTLEGLNKAFDGFARYEMGTGTARTFNGSTFILPLSELRTLAAQPVVKTVLAETMTVAAKVSEDGKAFMANLPKLLAKVGEWAGGSKVTALPKAPAAPKAPVTPKVAGSFTSFCPFGIFRPNTCKAALSALLSDGMFHTIAALRAECQRTGTTTGQINVAIKGLSAKGFNVEYGPGKATVKVSK